jgi:GH15 family glucan-1,4-alpha-glucosidase
MSNTAISDHALLSDRHSSALVDRSGSVEWLNFPRFDSPSVFGRLLSPDAGHWSITPSGDWTSASPQRHVLGGAGPSRCAVRSVACRTRLRAWVPVRHA